MEHRLKALLEEVVELLSLPEKSNKIEFTYEDVNYDDVKSFSDMY